MNKFLALVLASIGYIKGLLEDLREIPVNWQATLNGQPVELTGIALRLDMPQSRYRVKYRTADGMDHLIEADHDFDGKPPDALWLDGVLIDRGDVDIMPKLHRMELWLQFEWPGAPGQKDNRLRLITDLTASPVGKIIEDIVE